MSGQGTLPRSLTLRSHFGADRHPSLSLQPMYFALLRGNPVAGGAEPDGTGAYTRVPRDNDAALWGTYSAGDTILVNKGSNGAIVWPSSSGAYSITDNLDYWAIYDLSAGGTLWYYGQLQTPIKVTVAGGVPRIPANSLTNNFLA